MTIQTISLFLIVFFYRSDEGITDFAQCLAGVKIDNMMELTYHDRKRLHNLKYFTWIEQQGKTIQELNAQWYDDKYWTNVLSEAVVDKFDAQIMEFNHKTGLAQKYGMK